MQRLPLRQAQRLNQRSCSRLKGDRSHMQTTVVVGSHMDSDPAPSMKLTDHETSQLSVGIEIEMAEVYPWAPQHGYKLLRQPRSKSLEAHTPHT